MTLETGLKKTRAKNNSHTFFRGSSDKIYPESIHDLKCNTTVSKVWVRNIIPATIHGLLCPDVNSCQQLLSSSSLNNRSLAINQKHFVYFMLTLNLRWGEYFYSRRDAVDRPSYDTGHVYVTPANPQRLRNSKVNWIVILRYISIISSGCNLESRNVFLFSTSDSRVLPSGIF